MEGVSLRLPAGLENLEQFISFVSGQARQYGFDSLRLKEIELCTEEALVNIFNYAYSEKTGDVVLTCRGDGDKGFIIEICDYGEPFDIDSIPTPEIDGDISDRKVGGLGIYFIHRLIDEVIYRREGDMNILTFIIYKKQSDT
ncbi:MAG TPA: ATP-binding protein [Syntrophorhabdaceae bacterium]|nr:ATP-binding protein [Syntrophorhabdaceae bacterium]HPC67103.1 ATP-binding protein [Syntrophorhabdaceae bacterium]HPP41918.1 ATP-binding protein [Syntrophorhabdaceae bacterium]HQE80497.1 ATP-binding protein [Syntrophorhabdaceae bacterium]HQH43614.1 ATP-binding protein [Syntrophorhabdaceae bacterium]